MAAPKPAHHHEVRKGTGGIAAWEDLLRIAAVCGSYYLAVVSGLDLQLGFSRIAILWPGNAILVAALLLTPRNRWWLYLSAVIPVHIAAYSSQPVGAGWSAFQIVHNSALAVGIATVMRRFTPETPRFKRVKETAAFLTAGTLAPGLLALVMVGTVSLALPREALLRHGWSGPWWQIARQMAWCDLATVLGIVPGILVWTRSEEKLLGMIRLERMREILLLACTLGAATFVVFTRRDIPLYLQSALFLVPMTFLLWAAARFGARGAATALMAIVSISAWGLYHSGGPFIEGSAADHAVSVQLFWILLTFPGLSLAAAIEERKEVEETLRRGQLRYELATAAGQVAVWSYNYRTDEVFADRALTHMLGYLEESAKTRGDWLRRIHPDDVEAVLARERAITRPDAVRNATGDTPIPQLQYRFRCADGSYRWINNSGTLYRDGASPLLSVGTITDISELKKAQETSVANQKLESLGLLAGGIAHDFNNLLGSIHAQAELAEAKADVGSFGGEEIQTIKTIAIRASEIVRQLMIYAGHEKSTFAPVDLSRLVAEMLALLKISVSKQAILRTDLAEDLPRVWGNESEIRQVVMNLVLNASDALGEEGGAIRISTSLAVQMGSSGLPTAKLVVADTGCGISREAQDRIFDPFYTTKFAGRGLGLAVVQGIVRAHTGAIGLSSAPGKGTTFEILWPALPAVVERPSRAPSKVHAVESGRQKRGTVLVVEDEVVLRLSVSKMLRKEGFTVLEAGDGSTAVDVFRDHSADIELVLLDMTIPGAASRTVIAEAARIRPDVRVLLTSAYSREMAGPAVEASQVRGFIRKPFRLKELVGLIQETLAH